VGSPAATTTRGLGCLQAARLLNGQLGVLGRDNAFHNDGRFHPIPLDSIGHPGTCSTLDANHRLIASVLFAGIPASASVNSECYPPWFTSGVPKSKLCDPRSLRILCYGHGTYRGRITYERVSNGVGPPLPTPDGLRVGRISFRLP
jgi:hypothetical protein